MKPINDNDIAAADLERPDHDLRKRFLFFRANHRHLFGAGEGVDLNFLFRKHIAVKEKAPRLYDMENLEYAMKNYRIEDEYGALALATQQAVMVSSFHFGPYNLLGAILSNEGVQFSVLANGAKYYQQMKAYQIEKADELKHGQVVLTNEDVINPNDFTTMIQMMLKVREGRSMLVYADGLEGQGGYFDHSRMETVPFLGRKIYARKGTASLAYKLKLPIIFAMVEREEAGFVVRFFPVLQPEEYTDRASFVKAYCRLGYKHLESYVTAAPEQWEIFDRLHVWLAEEDLEEQTAPLLTERLVPEWCKFNKARFGIFVENKLHYLLDTHTRQVTGLSPGISELLSRIDGIRSSVVGEVLPVDTFHQLFNRGILIASDLREQSVAA
jgi:lauroyl/myristoyl acyltransferase